MQHPAIINCRSLTLPFSLNCRTSGKNVELRSNVSLVSRSLRDARSSIALSTKPALSGVIVLLLAFGITKLRTSGAHSEENVDFDPPWGHLECLKTHMGLGRHSKNVVDFLESALIRLRNPREDRHQRGDVECGIGSESSLTCKGRKHTGKVILSTAAQNREVGIAQAMSASVTYVSTP